MRIYLTHADRSGFGEALWVEVQMGARHGRNVWRILFRKMQPAAANILWIADCDNIDHIWAVFKEKITRLN